LKPLYVAGVAGAIAAVGIIAGLLYVTPAQVVSSTYHSDPFTVTVLEDSSHRFLAKIENAGPPLENTAVFAVKRGLNADCEPQGIVAANFKIENKGGKPVMDPSTIPAKGSVTVDSASANISQIPQSADIAIYVLKVDPSSLRAIELVQKIPIRQSNYTELQQFENCLLATSGSGHYPLVFKLTNIPKGVLAYFTVNDGSASYETSFRLDKNAPDFAAIYWPDAKQNWSQGNFTRPGGPAPAWKEPHAVTVNVRTVLAGQVHEFEKQIELSDNRLKTTSLDFFEVARGNIVPAYPKYWQVQVDLQEGIIS
jgi:hypothetical protein